MVTQFIHSAMTEVDYLTTDLNALADDAAFLGAAINNGTARWIIEDALQEEGFTRFGHGATFFHVGCRSGNPERVIWTY